MERTIHGDFGWRGMNSRVAPERLEPGYASYINNLYPNDDGVLELRPGWIGLLTTAQGYPIYWMNTYRTGDVHRAFWSSNNQLWGLNSVGNANPVNVTGTAVVTSGPGMQGARWGSFLYGIDGVNPMWRINGTTTPLSDYPAAQVLSLATPTTAPGVTLGASATLVNNINTTSNYSQPYAMDTGNYYPNNTTITAPNFEGSSGTTIASPWNVSAGQPTVVTSSLPVAAGGLPYIQMDFFGGTAAKEYVITNALTCPDDSDNTGAKLYLFQANAWAKNSGTEAQVLQAEVQLFNSTPSLISGTDTPQYSATLSGSTATKVWMVFDHRSVTSDPATFKVRIGAPNAVSGSGGNGVHVNQVQVLVPEQKLELAATNTSLVVKRGSVLAYGGLLYTAGLRIYNTSLSNQNWSGKTGIFFDITTPPEVMGLSLRLLLKSGSTWYSGGVLIQDPNGGYVADLTQFSSTVLSDVDGIGLEFTEDTYIESIVDGIRQITPVPKFGLADATVFTLNAIKDAGELSNGYTYTYRFSEWDGSTVSVSTYESTDGRESSGSPISVDVTTTASQRQAVLAIPEKVNTASTDQFLVWREGGVYDDGRYRLVGVVTAAASGATAFTDNVSDAALFDRPIYQIGRDPFPSGLTAIAVHQGRLWAAKGNTVYVSWVLQEGQESGVYTTLVPDPDDPYLGTKGASFTLDSNQNKDNIKALVPMGTVMLAIREYSVSVISGYDASNFAAQPYLRGNDAGMVGGNASVVRGKAWYMSALGVMEFNGDTPTWVSSDIEGSLIARSINPQICYYNDRVFVFNDSAVDDFGIGNGLNGQVHVYDYRTNGWVRWTTPGGGTSSAMAIGNIRRTTLYSGSQDGQIYVLNMEGGNATIQYGDKALPSTNPAADVSYELTTRAYGQYNNFNPSRLGEGRMTQIDVDLQAASGSNTTTVEIRNDANVVIGSRAYNLPTSRKSYSFRGFISSAKSIWHRIRFSGSAKVNVLINATHAYFSESEVPRI